MYNIIIYVDLAVPLESRPPKASNCTPRVFGEHIDESDLQMGAFFLPYNHSANSVWAPGTVLTG